ncbi:putative ubiquitin-conjugating enzyme E2 [Megavirus vitis]|uniref:E2 ubiquitin-conjugating enzyme n=2 Tax=unclassified Megavirus TaxID=3068396 RepID=A0A2K9V836_9VIRU|nr:putative ubiquitin-conjugating enzyme E2 [Megavirus courdo7]AUV58371.1 ubiquitin-conjugating enzyme E2 [Bandra megavirus]AVL93756.1 putative ubiquitin-conjugating enzyme E2 [Megavirus vitis]
MSHSNIRRIQNELKIIDKERCKYIDLFTIEMIDDNIYCWKAHIKGPENSLYDNYKFELKIELPDDYPYTPPKVKFITPVQHMNINDKGDICLSILKKDGWSASQNIISILLSIIVLLDQPNSEDPFNSELAHLYRSNKSKYEKTIKNFCKKNSNLWN